MNIVGMEFSRTSTTRTYFDHPVLNVKPIVLSSIKLSEMKFLRDASFSSFVSFLPRRFVSPDILFIVETPKNTPTKHSFQRVDLMSPSPNRVEVSRRSSVSSVTSDASSLFPMYESPPIYHFQVCPTYLPRLTLCLIFQR